MKTFAALVLLLCIIGTVKPESYNIEGVLRDFWPCTAKWSSCGQDVTGTKIDCGAAGYTCHPDFEDYNGEDKGIPQTLLGTDGKPLLDTSVSNPSIKSESSFYAWYRDQGAQGQKYSIRVPYNVTVTNNPYCDDRADPDCDKTFTYSNSAFFPLDKKAFGDYSNSGHNFHFTFELKHYFKYRKGQVYEFKGDDDLWVFVNGKLVVDLGGVHGEQTAKLYLDNLKLSTTGTHTFQVFFAERHTSASNYKISTDIEFQCGYYDSCGECNGDGQACCKNCAGKNQCFLGKCDILTGACNNTVPKVCPTTTDKCNPWSCDPVKGCVQTPVECKATDGNCNVGSCIDGACQYTPIDDDNDCTTRTCTNGVLTFPDTWTRSTPCTNYYCENGKRKSSPVVCPSVNPSNKCQINGFCNETVGCQWSAKNCGDDDYCTTNERCDTATGNCLRDNRVCQKETVNPVNLCGVGVCNSTAKACQTNYPATCTTCNPVCDNSDPCVQYQCSNSVCVPIEVCHEDPKSCVRVTCKAVGGVAQCNPSGDCTTTDQCDPQQCNFQSGKCESAADPCDDSDPCTVDSCKDNGDGTHTCQNVALCPTTDLCDPLTCVAGQCVHNVVTCDDDFACTDDSCNSETGKCQYIAKDCNDNKNCTRDYCSNGTCFNDVECNDGSLCTTDFCNDTTGECVFEAAPLPEEDNKCLLTVCDPVLGNISSALECRPSDRCSCDPTVGCVCTPRKPALTPAAAGGLAGGVVAGIVIASVVGAAALAFGGKKGYDFIQSEAMKSGEISNNPLYEDAAAPKENPLFEQSNNNV